MMPYKDRSKRSSPSQQRLSHPISTPPASSAPYTSSAPSTPALPTSQVHPPAAPPSSKTISATLSKEKVDTFVHSTQRVVSSPFQVQFNQPFHNYTNDTNRDNHNISDHTCNKASGAENTAASIISDRSNCSPTLVPSSKLESSPRLQQISRPQPQTKSQVRTQSKSNPQSTPSVDSNPVTGKHAAANKITLRGVGPLNKEVAGEAVRDVGVSASSRTKIGRPSNVNENPLIRRLECVLSVQTGRCSMTNACRAYDISARTFYRWLRDKPRLIQITGITEADFCSGAYSLAPLSASTANVTKPTLQRHAPRQVPPSSQSVGSRSLSDVPLATPEGSPDSLPRLQTCSQGSPDDISKGEPMDVTDMPAAPTDTVKTTPLRKLPFVQTQPRRDATLETDNRGAHAVKLSSVSPVFEATTALTSSLPLSTFDKSSEGTTIPLTRQQSTQQPTYSRTPYQAQSHEPTQLRSLPKPSLHPLHLPRSEYLMRYKSPQYFHSPPTLHDIMPRRATTPNPELVELDIHAASPRTLKRRKVDVKPNAERKHYQHSLERSEAVANQEPDLTNRDVALTINTDRDLPQDSPTTFQQTQQLCTTCLAWRQKRRIVVTLQNHVEAFTWYADTAAIDIRFAISRRFALTSNTAWALVDDEGDEIVISWTIPSAQYTLTLLR